MKTKLPIQKTEKFRKICQFLFFRATTPKTLGVQLNLIIHPLNRPWQVDWRWVRQFWMMPSKDIPKTKQKNLKITFFWLGSKISFDGSIARPRTQRQLTWNGWNRVRECYSQFIWAIFDSPSLCFHFTKKLVKLKIQQLNCCIRLF